MGWCWVEEGRGFVRAEPTGGRRCYRPPSMREVSLRVRSWEDFRVEFYGWLDDFYRFPEERERMVRDQIALLPDRQAVAPDAERVGGFEWGSGYSDGSPPAACGGFAGYAEFAYMAGPEPLPRVRFSRVL